MPSTSVFAAAAVLASIVAPTADGAPIVLAEDRTVQIEAGGQIDIPLAELVTGAETPVFFSGDVSAEGPCQAQAGRGWDSLAIAVPRSATGTCEVAYLPRDAQTGSAPLTAGVVTVEITAEGADDTPAADGDEETAAAPTSDDQDEEAAPETAGEPAPEVTAPQQATAVSAEETVTVTLHRSDLPYVGGAAALVLLVALIRRAVRRSHRTVPPAPAAAAPLWAPTATTNQEEPR